MEEGILSEEDQALFNNYANKYVGNKSDHFKMNIIELFNLENIQKYFFGDKLPFLRKYIKSLKEKKLQLSQDNSIYDELIDCETKISDYSELMNDIILFKKVLEKRNIYMTYFEIINKINQIIENEYNIEYESFLSPFIKRYKNMQYYDKKSIIKDLLNLGFSTSHELISNIFMRLDIDFTDQEIVDLYNECTEEIELEIFENNMGKTIIDSKINYQELDPKDFEIFIKELFIKMGYKAITTKFSGDQGADVVIEKNGKKTVVQVKKYSKVVSNSAIQEVVASIKYYKADNALVVTTGTFSASAIELADANEVELWDKAILDEKIKKFTLNNIKENKIYLEQKINIFEDNISIKCPFCHSIFHISIDDFPNRNKDMDYNCPECDFPLSLSQNEKLYTCEGCKKLFDTIIERREHILICKIVEERKIHCYRCDMDLFMDDEEYQQYSENGKIITKCPNCSENIIK